MSTSRSSLPETRPQSAATLRGSCPSASDSSILPIDDGSDPNLSSGSSFGDETDFTARVSGESAQPDHASATEPTDLKPRLFSKTARVDSEDTLQGPDSRQQTFQTTSPSSTLKEPVTTHVTPVTPTLASPMQRQTKFGSLKTTLQTWYYDYWLQFSMVSLALLGLLTAVAHHLYNNSLNGREVEGDPQWPPRYGNALAFFLKAILITSVQIAYKQQAWISVKKQALKVSTLDALFAVYYDPFQFTSLEFLTKTWLPAILAIVSWALPLCAIASPSTLTSIAGSQTLTTTCPNIPIMNFTREANYTLAGADDALSGLANWNVVGDKQAYTYAAPSPALQRIFTLSALSSTGPIQPAANPCPVGTNCTYAISFTAAAYGCEARDDFGGSNPPQLKKSDLAPAGDLVYGSYSSLPMGAEDGNGAPLAWANMTASNPNDPMIGAFTGLPSLWLGWCTATPTPLDAWANLVPHVAECQMYNATYSFDIAFESGRMSIANSRTQLNGLLLPAGSTKFPNETDYLEFGSYHATGVLFRNLLHGNATLANKDDLANEYVITWTPATQTTLLNPNTQLPADPTTDLASAASAFYRDLFVSMLSDAQLHDVQPNTTLPCTVTAPIQIWAYEPFWLVLPYGVAMGVVAATLAVGMHGFWTNGYAADACFSTFVMTSRSRDLDELCTGSCLGRWPKERGLMESRLRFGEVEGAAGREPHAAFAFEGSVRDFDRRKGYVRRVEKA